MQAAAVVTLGYLLLLFAGVLPFFIGDAIVKHASVSEMFSSVPIAWLNDNRAVSALPTRCPNGWSVK